MLYCSGEFFLAYAAVGIHEAAHALACIKLKIPPKGLFVNAFGMKLTIPDLKYFKEKIIVYSAGPTVSFCAFFVSFIILSKFLPECYFLYFFSLANLSAAVVNLIPVTPLDGASMLKAFLVRYFGIVKGGKIIKKISSFFVVALIFLNLFFILSGIFNPGLFIFIIFLFNGLNEEKTTSVKNEKMVFSGEVYGSKKIKLIKCDAESELLSMAALISFDYTVLFTVFSEGRFLGEIYQDELIHGINTMGALSTARDYIKSKKYGENFV